MYKTFCLQVTFERCSKPWGGCSKPWGGVSKPCEAAVIEEPRKKWTKGVTISATEKFNQLICNFFKTKLCIIVIQVIAWLFSKIFSQLAKELANGLEFVQSTL